MTSIRLRNSLTAALAFTVAAMLIVGSAFAADGGNGKSKRRGDSGKFNTGTFQIVVPKADRGGSGRQVAKFVAPKADRGNGGNPGIITIPPKANRTTAQFVAPKADRGTTGGPTTLFSVSPKAPRTGNGPTVVKFVAPKAPRGDGPIVATAEPPKFAAPQLLAPASAPTPVKVEQAISAPAPVETKAAAPVVAASETPAPAPAATETNDHEVELAYVRAGQRYGYGDHEGGYENYDQGYDDAYTGGSYGDDGCY